MIAGVAGGLAEYLEVDALLVRLAFVAFALTAGVGVLLYIVAWLIVPEEKESPMEQNPLPPEAPHPPQPEGGQAPPVDATEAGVVPNQQSVTAETPPAPPPAAPGQAPPREESSQKRTIAGLILIVIGAVFFANQFLDWLTWDTLWPLVLIAIGVLVLMRGRRS